MSQAFGLMSREQDDVSHELLRMIRASPGAPADAYGVASPIQVEHSVRRPELTSVVSDVLLGYGMSKVVSYDAPQPVLQDDKAIAFVGRLWDTLEPDALSSADALRRHGYSLGEHVRSLEGSYVVAVAGRGEVAAASDPMGVVPLYYGSDDLKAGLSTNPSSLSTLSLRPMKAQPGDLVTLSRGGVSVSHLDVGVRPRVRLAGATVDSLDTLLENHVIKRQNSRRASSS